MTNDSPVSDINGVGPELAAKLKILGIETVFDLIDYYPRKYEDYSNVQTINNIKPGIVTVEAVIKQVKGRYVRRGMYITEAIASDENNSVRLIWFNQPYREASIKTSEKYYISGNYQLSKQRFSIMNPSIEMVNSFPINTARIIPIYKETKGLASWQIRKLLKEVRPIISSQIETLPKWIIKENGLLERNYALEAIHFPKTSQNLTDAVRRLGFDEVFVLILAGLLNKYELLKDESYEIPFVEDLAKKFVSELPFKLTGSQRRAIWQIYQDISKSQPMNRLIEGDVGSGKTVVATMAAIMAIYEGYQVAFMAPTEILARQHAETINQLLKPLGMDKLMTLVTGGMKTVQKKTANKYIADSSAMLAVGTHALIQDNIKFSRLGLVIVDEQHRFGVEQRKRLMSKAGQMPHLLSLTATPIPRSLALTVYGELDISVIEEKPAGRKPVTTKVISPNSKEQIYKKIYTKLDEGRQMFVVCPLINESAILNVSSAEQVYKDLNEHSFKNYRIGLLHGKMSSEQKTDIMNQFLKHEIDILVSTTVIEVGVDIPNASIMMIEAADRFGLAQIHQLRGRIGRGGHEGFCYLILSSSSAASDRIKILERVNDGFKLAELDLSLRGPGAIYGTMQHGQLDLRLAKLSDTKLISSARQTAQKFIRIGEALHKYQFLNKKVNSLRTVTNLN